MKILRRGQASIEFALILPIFALLLFSLVYIGFLFIDVVTLDSAAAAAARSAVLSDDGTVDDALKTKIQNTTLFLYWYEIDSESPKRLEPVNDANIFTYGIKANLTVKNSVLEMVLPPAYTVVKTAYKTEATTPEGGD
ncbi:MAG: pilus assembly protein [Selenomonadaceae bacterium]|nr:pilus assembly protein [Selenomonadaceae bacterium]